MDVLQFRILFLCFWLYQVTKVVVEAESVMMNGAVQGMCGTAGLALAAATHDTPFIVLCHTYKFSNNDLTDSLVVNELGKFVCCIHSGGKGVLCILYFPNVLLYYMYLEARHNCKKYHVI